MSITFERYGQNLRHSLTLGDIAAENSIDGMLFARAEQSGSEGCYCEVAKWNETARQWQRYAFEKFFGGEFGGEDLKSYETAERVAAYINSGGAPYSRYSSLIHTFPNYGTEWKSA